MSPLNPYPETRIGWDTEVERDGAWLIRTDEAWDTEEDRPGPLWWSNITGWGSKAGATPFSKTETERLRLPVGGRWVRE